MSFWNKAQRYYLAENHSKYEKVIKAMERKEKKRKPLAPCLIDSKTDLKPFIVKKQP